MYVHNEQIRFLQDDYESERVKQGKSKDEFYNDMIFIGAHIAEGNFFIEKKIDWKQIMLKNTSCNFAISKNMLYFAVFKL